MAERANLPDVATGHLAWATSMELAYGNLDRASQQARRVLARKPSYDPKLRAAMALAATGSTAEAEGIAAELARGPSRAHHHQLRPRAHGPGRHRAASRGGRSGRSSSFGSPPPTRMGFVAALGPIYLRGQSYLMQGSGPQAAEEFQRILDHRGSDPFSPFYAVAPLGLARARAIAGDVAGSLQAYEQFLAAWAEADPDIPVLVEARKEYARLQRSDRASGSGSGKKRPLT